MLPIVHHYWPHSPQVKHANDPAPQGRRMVSVEVPTLSWRKVRHELRGLKISDPP